MSLILRIKQIIWKWTQGTPSKKPATTTEAQSLHVFSPEHTKCGRWVLMCDKNLTPYCYRNLQTYAVGGKYHQRDAMINTDKFAFSFDDYDDLQYCVRVVMESYNITRNLR